ncbi:NmrA family NAD(P)-binding protein [Chryseobacterium sp. MP_3.2]|uniref:NmrA family NAD(P)-binding protein n=1 Tax=Chryseobacterium sp. MP_3.2 TaxID=3071712 RepID=UPI002DFDB366|nr:uncharacterized protein YbjT (DUF2867 family) [Chryseobacterium sp. MP_3.2]
MLTDDRETTNKTTFSDNNNMTKILITGATGNVGIEVLSALKKLDHQLEIYAGVRDTEFGNEKLSNFNIKTIKFDFMNIETFLTALKDVDVLFLLRPPQISDVKKYFAPLIETAKKSSVKHIVFLSVQGVENSKIIPHHKIEKLIVDSRIPYTFLRPAYFMQNFTTTLRNDLVNNHSIYLPAGQAKFTVIDAEDIGSVAAKVLIEPQNHINKSYELTNNETLTFAEMAEKISNGIGKTIKFISPNLLQFFLTKRKENRPTMLILVMIMLHYFPRFQKTPKTTEWVKIITGQDPKSFDDFVLTNKNQL